MRGGGLFSDVAVNGNTFAMYVARYSISDGVITMSLLTKSDILESESELVWPLVSSESAGT